MKTIKKTITTLGILSLICGIFLFVQACGDTNITVSPVSSTSGTQIILTSGSTPSN